MKLLRKIALVLLAAISVTGIVACDNNEKPNVPDDPTETPGGPSDPSDPSKPNDPSEPEKPVESTPATGAFSYVSSSYEERTEILGVLEKYAVDNNLTGITLYENGGYVMHADNIVKGTENYIPGYGFGIIEEGSINADLPGETNPNWKRYYHDYEPENPNVINYMDDDGSVVGNLIGYVSGAFWNTRMNETKDGYEWYNMLAKTKPIAVNADSTGQATKYKFALKTGKDGIKYSTLTSNSVLKKYNGMDVQAEDYLNGFKVLWNQSYGLERGADQLSGTGAIKGAQEYYNGTKNGYNDSAWDKVAIDIKQENGDYYMYVEFIVPTSSFYAMYYLASQLYAPIPSSFISELETVSNTSFPAAYGKLTDNGLTPVDTFLSTGPYVLEAWNSQEIVMKKNAFYNEEGRYNIAGLYFDILEAAKNDTNAAFKEFLANKLSGVGIPKDYLAEYKSDRRTTTTIGSTTTKFNLNTCTAEEWEYLFGEHGTIKQNTKEEYYEVEPIMSNENFVKGLSYALNRVSYAETMGVTPSVNFFGSSYMSDPENGIIYNNTQAHKDAIADLIAGTDGYGYSEELAIQSFKAAADALIADGTYKVGDTITIDIVWQSQANVDNTGKQVENFWLTAWNKANTGLTLKFNDIVPSNWQDAYTVYMQAGKFDIGYGGIEGNPLNPLNFMYTLKSDNESGFTLNWGPNTNELSKDIEYDGHYWSFDGLWKAADSGGYFENGINVPSYTASVNTNSVVINKDGSASVTIDISMISGIENVDVTFDKTVIFGYADAEGNNYMEEEVTSVLSEDKKQVVVTLSKELVDKYNACQYPLAYDPNGEITCVGIDVYFNTTVFGVSSNNLISVYVSLK